MTRTLAALALSLPLSLSACDKGSDQTEAPGGDTPASDGSGDGEETTAATEPGAPGVAWADKNRQQRMETMGLVVFPSMKEAFAGHDAERFGDFKCQTCHGDDAKDVDYKMPNAVTPLSKDDPVGDGNGIDEAMTKFMMESVVPKMKEHLEGAEVNCHSCHLEG